AGGMAGEGPARMAGEGPAGVSQNGARAGWSAERGIGGAGVGVRVTESELTVEQAELDGRLREWRKGESERLGLPQFFVLAASALRGIVLARPRTVAELGRVAGLDPEKMRQFGETIVGICNAQAGAEPTGEA
ncbi:MAG: HRDC domain-containing protein, partial [Acidobacteriota bacterium]|nr:HRDC domain-containing protein [Acidobacteriota bacterium]